MKTKMLRSLLLIALLIAGTAGPVSPAAAGDGVWTGSGPDGGTVSALAVDPHNSDILYAGTNGAVYRSTDGGLTWRNGTSSGLPYIAVRGLAVAPAAPPLGSAVYAGTSGAGIFKSTDGDASWQLVEADEAHPEYNQAPILLVDPATPSTVYAVTYGGVLKSTDGGGSWRRVNSGMPTWITALAVDPGAPATLYAATGADRSVYKSTDGGESWAKSGQFGGETYALAVAPGTPSTVHASVNGMGLYVSEDGGAIWTWRASDEFVVLIVDPQTPSTLYAAHYGNRIYKSTDRGATWRTVIVDENNRAGVHVLAPDPSTSGTLYAGAM